MKKNSAYFFGAFAAAALLGSSVLSSAAWAQDIPAPPRALLETQTRFSQWERQQEEIRREAELTRLRLELMRAQQELRLLGGEGNLPGVVATFSHEGDRSALLGEAGGAQWVVKEGEVLPSGHRVERIQSGSVVVVEGEGRRATRTTLRPLPAVAAEGATGPAGAVANPAFPAPPTPAMAPRGGVGGGMPPQGFGAGGIGGFIPGQ